jgi:hypothetical protein
MQLVIQNNSNHLHLKVYKIFRAKYTAEQIFIVEEYI